MSKLYKLQNIIENSWRKYIKIKHKIRIKQELLCLKLIIFRRIIKYYKFNDIAKQTTMFGIIVIWESIKNICEFPKQNSWINGNRLWIVLCSN